MKWTGSRITKRTLKREDRGPKLPDFKTCKKQQSRQCGVGVKIQANGTESRSVSTHEHLVFDKCKENPVDEEQFSQQMVLEQLCTHIKQ